MPAIPLQMVEWGQSPEGLAFSGRLSLQRAGEYEPVVEVPTNTPPTVIVSPPPGSPLAPQSPVHVYVRDAEGLRRTVIMVAHARGVEVAWDGSRFEVGYRTSERSGVTGGEDFTLRRDAGWPAAGFTLRVLPLDTAGEEG
jgi:hypothetical protein